MGRPDDVFSHFELKDYCLPVKDPSVCAKGIRELIVSEMDTYIQRSFPHHAKNEWFSHTYFRAPNARESSQKVP